MYPVIRVQCQRRPSGQTRRGKSDDERFLCGSDAHQKYPTSFSPDGKLLLYMVYLDLKTKSQLFVLPMTGPETERKPHPFAQTSFNETWGQFSPDGRWIAYASDESRRNEIYVAPFPGGDGKRQISTNGGEQPLWREDSREIFYIAPDRQLMAAEVTVKGGVLQVDAVRALFGPIPVTNGAAYDVANKGQRFLVRIVPQTTNTEPLTAVRNWTSTLKK